MTDNRQGTEKERRDMKRKRWTEKGRIESEIIFKGKK